MISYVTHNAVQLPAVSDLSENDVLINWIFDLWLEQPKKTRNSYLEIRKDLLNPEVQQVTTNQHRCS